MANSDPETGKRRHRAPRSNSEFNDNPNSRTIRILSFRVAPRGAVHKPLSGLLGTFDCQANGMTLVGLRLFRGRTLQMIIAGPKVEPGEQALSIDDPEISRQIIEAVCPVAEAFGCHVGAVPE